MVQLKSFVGSGDTTYTDNQINNVNTRLGKFVRKAYQGITMVTAIAQPVLAPVDSSVT